MEQAEPLDELTVRELHQVLVEEIGELPKKLRLPIVLCFLQGKTHIQAAKEIGCPRTSLTSRLTRALDILRQRLTKRGITVSSVALAAALGEQAKGASVGALLTINTVAAVSAIVGGKPVARGVISAQAIALAEEVGRMAVGVRATLVLSMLALGLAVGAAAFAARASWTKDGPPGPATDSASPRVAQQTKNAAAATDAYGDPLPKDALMRLGSIRLQHDLSCFGVAFSPVSDLLVSSGFDGIRLWDAKSGKELRHIAGPLKDLSAVAISPDGKLLAASNGDGVVCLWEASTGNVVRRLEGRKDAVRALAFSAQGDLLAVGDHSNLRLWEVSSGKLLHVMEGKEGGIDSVAFSPDGRLMAAAGLGIWDTATGKKLHALPGAEETYCQAIFFSKDGQFLITVGQDATVVWETATGQQRERLKGPGQFGATVALSPDGRTLAIGGRFGVVRLWDWAAAKEVRVICRQVLDVQGVAFSRSGNTLASADNRGKISLWDVATGQPKGPVSAHRQGLTSVAYVPGTARLATAAWDGTVRLWDTNSGKEAVRLEIPQSERDDHDKTGPNALPTGVEASMLGHFALSPDGKLFAASRWDKVIVMWDAVTGKEVKRFPGSRLAFSPDNKLIACIQYVSSSSRPKSIWIYDRGTVKKLRELPTGLRSISFDLPVFLPDSKTLMAIEFVPPRNNKGAFGMESHIVSWDATTGRESKGFDGMVGYSADYFESASQKLSPDGRTLATDRFFSSDRKTDSNAILLWETASGQRRGELSGDKGQVRDIAFSPDGRLVASAATYSAARLWDLYSCKEIGNLEGHRGWVHAVAFAPDGKTLATGSTDATALIWDLRRFSARAKPTELTAEEVESCWKDLAADAQVAFRALGKMILSPKQTVKHLSERLKPTPVAEAQHLKKLIADLDSDQFKTRDLATIELEKLGEAATSALEKAVAANIPLETKRRLERLLEKLVESQAAPEMLRQVRAVEALERLATADARQLLEKLVAEGAPGARLTREAEMALTRLRQRVGNKPLH
jgi:WD40 repeat protein